MTESSPDADPVAISRVVGSWYCQFYDRSYLPLRLVSPLIYGQGNSISQEFRKRSQENRGAYRLALDFKQVVID